MSAAKSWIVQTGFGTRLGPMPDDALKELVRTGALVRSDQVCDEAAGDWQSASEIPGLFDSESLPQPLPMEDCSPLVDEGAKAAPTNAILVSSPKGLIPPAPPIRPSIASAQTTEPVAPTVVAPVAVSPAPDVPEIEPQVVAEIMAAPVFDVPPVMPPISPESELISAWKVNRSRSKEDLGLESLADEMTQAEAVEDFAPELPSDLLDDDDDAASSVVAVPASKPSRQSLQQPAFLDQVAGLEAGPRQPVETARQKWDRWRRSLPSRPISVVLAVVIFTAVATWWLFPRSQRAIYNRYVALWTEWKQRRGDLKDKEGWERFLKRADAELNDIVPWLEKNTRATDNEKKLLLFIGRDCLRKIRMQPRQQGMSQEKQLEGLLAQAREYYEPSGSAAPREVFIGAKSVPPKKSVHQPAMMNRPTGVVPVAPGPSRLPEELPIAVPKPAALSTPPPINRSD